MRIPDCTVAIAALMAACGSSGPGDAPASPDGAAGTAGASGTGGSTLAGAGGGADLVLTTSVGDVIHPAPDGTTYQAIQSAMKVAVGAVP